MSNEQLNTDFSNNNDTKRIELHFSDQNKFIILFILSLGLYGIWWMFKAWDYYKRKEITDIMPAARAIFALFFAYALFQKILAEAKLKAYTKTYDSSILFISFIGINLLGYLPGMFSLLSIFSFIAYIPAVNALNHAIDRDTVYRRSDNSSFSSRQILLLIIGGILWTLILLSVYLVMTGAIIE